MDNSSHFVCAVCGCRNRFVVVTMGSVLCPPCRAGPRSQIASPAERHCEKPGSTKENGVSPTIRSSEGPRLDVGAELVSTTECPGWLPWSASIPRI